MTADPTPARTVGDPGQFDPQPTYADIFREVTRLERALSDSASYWQQRNALTEQERDEEMAASRAAHRELREVRADLDGFEIQCVEYKRQLDEVRSIVESIVYAAPETWPLHIERLARLVLKERTNG